MEWKRVSTPLLSGLGLVFLSLLTLEGGLRLAHALELVTLRERTTEPHPFYRDMDPAFGVWHPPDSTYRHRADCFDVQLRSNSYGARDREHPRVHEGPRVVALGDSFVEGFGVEREERLTERLEGATGVPHLNFGTAGSFSSVQQWKLYETLASHFDHDRVLIFALPNNDFIENDPELFWEPERYRPYLVENGKGLELWYPTTLQRARREAEAQLEWNRLHNRLFLYRMWNLLRVQVRARLAQGRLPTLEDDRYGYVGYEQYRELDLARLTESYERIAAVAGSRPVHLFTIPRYQEFLYGAEHGHDFRLPRDLERFAQAHESIAYVDLLPFFLRHSEKTGTPIRAYFHECDGHWSPLGHRVAAAAVRETVAYRERQDR